MLRHVEKTRRLENYQNNPWWSKFLSSEAQVYVNFNAQVWGQKRLQLTFVCMFVEPFNSRTQ